MRPRIPTFGGVSRRVVLTGLFLVYAIPAYFMLATSLRTNEQVFEKPLSFDFEPTLQSYKAIEVYDIPAAIWISVRITFLVTAIVLVLGIPTAYAMARAVGRWRGIGLGALIVLQLLPASTLVIPLYKVLQTWGMLGTLQGVILAQAAYFLPFAVILLRPFFLAIPVDLETAAAVDGASRVRIFLQIVLPLARNGVITVGVLLAMIVWGDFLFAVTLLIDTTDFPLSALVAQQVGTSGIDWPRLMALAIVTAAPVIAIFLVMERRLTAGLSAGGVK